MSSQSLFPRVHGIGHAFFWCPTSEVMHRLRQTLSANGVIEMPIQDEDVLCFISDDFESLVPFLDAGLTPDERKEVKVLLSDRSQPQLVEFAHMRSIAQLELQLSAYWLGDMLAERRYKSLMQPIVTAGAHSQILGYEFLIRGLQTDGKEVSAPVLFDTAEATDMLYALDMAAGESAARTACKHELQKAVFVNVLPRTINNEDGFETWLQAVLGNMDFNPGQMVFEIVESQQLVDMDAVNALVEKLHKKGIRIALDDFGSGFNNLGALNDMQPDFIKLDKSLTRDLVHDGRKWTLVANIVDSAKQSDIQVIAEGVEDAKTATVLETAGVDYLQGYYFGKPSDKPLRPAEG